MSLLQTRVPTVFHPAAGILILGFDWLLFSGGVITLGMSTPVLLIVGGLLTAMAVSTIQSRYMEDGRGRSLLKGVASGLLVGLPLPVAGTGVGGLVLALSGLNHLLDPDSSEGTDSPSRPKSR